MDNDMLSSLLNDPEALQNAMKAVSGMFGGNPEQAAPAASQPSVDGKSNVKTDYDPSADLMQHALPVISSIVQSGQNAVRQDKRVLLNAVKPFVSGEVAGQFDHAMRLVSMAKMARAALGQFGTGTQNRTGRTE